MATKATPEMNLKLLINTQDNKVVFAEAEKHFIDLLFNLLTLPIGTIVGFLPKEVCLGGLHKSVKKLEGAYLQPNQSSDSPLKLNTPAYAILPLFNPSSSRSNDPFFHCSSSRSYGHVQGLVTYMVTDDLSITPMSLTATMALFKKCNIEEVNVLEEKVVKIGFDEVNNPLAYWVLIDFFSSLFSCRFGWSYLFSITQLIGRCYLQINYQIIKPCLFGN